MDKKCKVVMLPTNKEATEDDILLFGDRLIDGSRISIPNDTVTFLNPIDKKLQSISGIDRFKPQYLYIVSDDEIKVGDGYIESTGLGDLLYTMTTKALNGWNVDENNRDNLKRRCRKTIATTDVSCTLPQLSQLFIEEYISEYNKGNKIEYVMVEFEELPDEWMTELEECPHRDYECRLKVDKDNIINIKPIKTIWTRDEVKQVLITCCGEVSCNDGTLLGKSPAELSIWIRDNL